MTIVNETIGFILVGLLAGSVVVGTVVAVKNKDQEKVSVEENRNHPSPVPVPAAKPPVTPPPPPPSHVQAVTKEIMEDNPGLSVSEVAEAVEKADRLDQIEQRIDEVVVEQRKLNDRIEALITKQEQGK